MTRPFLLALACVLALGCADDSNDEAVGDLMVITNTTGTPDADGYTLAVEGQAGRTLTSTDTTVYFGLPIETYTITLGEVEPGCNVTDGATRNKYVAVGSNSVLFVIVCP